MTSETNETAADDQNDADMEQRAAEEAKVAAEQDAALQAVKAQCDAFRAALKANEERT